MKMVLQSKIKWTPREYAQILIWRKTLGLTTTEFLRQATKNYLFFLWLIWLKRTMQKNLVNQDLQTEIARTGRKLRELLVKSRIPKKYHKRMMNYAVNRFSNSLGKKLGRELEKSFDTNLNRIQTDFLVDFSKKRQRGAHPRRKRGPGRPKRESTDVQNRLLEN